MSPETLVEPEGLTGASIQLLPIPQPPVSPEQRLAIWPGDRVELLKAGRLEVLFRHKAAVF